MEDDTVVVATLSQLCKVLACLSNATGDEGGLDEVDMIDPTYSRRMIPIQFQLNVSHARFEDHRLHC